MLFTFFGPSSICAPIPLGHPAVTSSFTTSIESTKTDNYLAEYFTLISSSAVTDTRSSIAVVNSHISATPANLSAHNPSFL